MGESDLRQPIDERFVGEGERACLTILKSMFGKLCEYKIQYPLSKLMSEEFKDTLSERQRKETLDIVIFRPEQKTIVVRVQDKHHKGLRISSIDLIQKQMLEWNNCSVVDLWWEECPNLWEDSVNEKSIEEVSTYLRKANLI